MASSATLSADEIKEVAGFCPLKDLIKALADDVPGVAEYVRRRLARYKADEMFKAAEASADDDEEVDDEVKAMSAMLLADSAPPSSVGPAAEVPPHSRILEQPRADTFQKSFDAQVQEAERKAMAPKVSPSPPAAAVSTAAPAAPPPAAAVSTTAPAAASLPPPAPLAKKQASAPAPVAKKPSAKKPSAVHAPVPHAVHAPGGGAGNVVVNPQDQGDFPSLGDTSLVGRATSGVRAGGIENRPQSNSGHMNPSVAPVFVPAAAKQPVPAPQPRVYNQNSFTNGMIFKANNSTYGECLQRQLFGLPANQMTRSLTNITVDSTALFLFNFQTNELEGVFVATAPPSMDIDPQAWAASAGRAKGPGRGPGGGSSPFPAQVRVRKVMNLLPVHCDAWEHLVTWHTNGSTFDLVLDLDTTRELIGILRG